MKTLINPHLSVFFVIFQIESNPNVLKNKDDLWTNYASDYNRLHF